MKRPRNNPSFRIKVRSKTLVEGSNLCSERKGSGSFELGNVEVGECACLVSGVCDKVLSFESLREFPSGEDEELESPAIDKKKMGIEDGIPRKRSRERKLPSSSGRRW
jgi:hypothetical protein